MTVPPEEDQPTAHQPPLAPERPSWTPEPREEPALPEPVFTPFSLTFGDGFKFGCGFMVAATIALLIGLLVLTVLLTAAGLAGIRLPVQF